MQPIRKFTRRRVAGAQLDRPGGVRASLLVAALLFEPNSIVVVGCGVSRSVLQSALEAHLSLLVLAPVRERDGEIDVNIRIASIAGVKCPGVETYCLINLSLLHQRETVVHQSAAIVRALFANVPPQGFLAVPHLISLIGAPGVRQ